MSLYKHKVGLLHALTRRPTRALQPLCMKCGRYLDSESLVEGYPGESVTAKVLGRHHGEEELVTFEMGSREWDETDLAKHIRGHLWFQQELVPK